MIFESALLNPSGIHVGWMGSIVDISERKALEEKERRHVEVQAQHARLNDLGLIASELAHEINQPLTTIVSYSAGLNLALRKRLPGDADVMHAVDEMHKHAKKAGDIVNWIRRQSSRSDPVRAACDINTIVQACIEHRSRPMERAGIRLQVDLGQNLPPVTVDRIGIEQVIANLLRNAADAQMGHVDKDKDQRQQVTDKLICITTRAHAGSDGKVHGVEVLVQDNGPGLQGKTMEVLGSTFYSTKQNGMGLGLGICRSIAESHAGQLSASDVDDAQSPCRGAQFCLTLPASQQLPQGNTL
jgi:two-component system sensor histidine kinase DctS